MTILEIRNTAIPSVIMNKKILNPLTHTIGDTAPAIFTSLSTVIVLHVQGMKEKANAIEPKGLTHLGAFHPQNSIAINRIVKTLSIHAGTVMNNKVIGPGPENSSITSSINSSSIKHLYLV